MEKLIIVESANKIKSIKKYITLLQKEGKLDAKDNYEIEASVGHIMELPPRWIPRCGETKWEHEKQTIRGKGKIVTKLRRAAKKAEVILLATDPDREGEAIAHDLMTKLKIEDKAKRISFMEITKSALLKAILAPRKIDEHIVEAQSTRLMLDRVMGYRLSSWLKYKIWNDFNIKSAGRVQSPTLKLVVERELLIEGFKPVPYVKIEQEFKNNIIANIVLDKWMINNNKGLLEIEHLKEVQKTLKGKLVVKEVTTKVLSGARKIPFKQSTVYRSSGMSAAASRRAMQSLFEKGLISYPRTDSTKYSQTFIDLASSYIKEKFGEEYLASSIKGTKTKATDQGAHEALRITDPKRTPSSVKLSNAGEIKMYRLIYNHTLQTLMMPPKREVLTYILDDNGYKFRMSSATVIFDGYLKVSGFLKDNELPKLSVGDSINSNKINYIKDETKPKARYNEGSLIAKMEEVGIGRPSTFSSTISILIKRKYVASENKVLKATPLGKAVAMALMMYFSKIINEEYTKELELKLDQIAEGDKVGSTMLTHFYEHLCEEIDNSKIKSKTENDEGVLEATTLIDISNLEKQIKTNKENVYGKSYCELINAFGKITEVNNKEIKIDYKQFAINGQENFKGPIMMPMKPQLVRTFIKCKNDYVPYSKGDQCDSSIICEKCKKNAMVYRHSIKRGKREWFMACSGYPKCKNAISIKENEQAILEKKYEKHNKNIDTNIDKLYDCSNK